MAMLANLIAHVAHVYLKDFNLRRLQWKKTNGFDFLFKGGELTALEYSIG
jgi:hypothetical protein